MYMSQVCTNWVHAMPHPNHIMAHFCVCVWETLAIQLTWINIQLHTQQTYVRLWAAQSRSSFLGISGILMGSILAISWCKRGHFVDHGKAYISNWVGGPGWEEGRLSLLPLTPYSWFSIFAGMGALGEIELLLQGEISVVATCASCVLFWEDLCLPNHMLALSLG